MKMTATGWAQSAKELAMRVIENARQGPGARLGCGDSKLARTPMPAPSPTQLASVSSLATYRARKASEAVDNAPSTDAAVAPERWVTKRQLAAHLQVTPRWIEQQQNLGLPHLRMPGINRYRISVVEAWLRERYGAAQARRSA
jgi:hypothetical protein